MASTTNPARKKRDVDINVRVSDILQDVMWKGKFKTVAENWNSRAPSTGTNMVYLETMA